MAKIDAGQRLQLNIQKWLFTILLLTVIGMLAWLSNETNWQADWTANKRNSLSQGSIALLQTLDGEVNVHVYTRDEGQLRLAVDEILKRYQREKDDFHYRIVNPDLDIEQAQADQVNRYGQIVVYYKSQREIISNLSEQAISGALLRLSRGGGKHIVFLSGHGERDPQQKDNRGVSTLATQLKTKGFTISKHNLLQAPLPDDTRVLVIANPEKPLLSGEIDQLQQYLNKGGNLLWLADPGEPAGLQALADSLGVSFMPGMVVDNNVNLRKTLRIEHPAIIPVLEYYPHEITRNINYNTLFPMARGVQVDHSVQSDWHGSVLWRSFERSWSETSSLGDEIVFSSEDGDIAGPVPLAVALEKVLPGEDEQQDKATQRVVVVGDSDFIANAYIGVGANLELANHVFNWLAGDDDLIAVDIKNAPDLQLRLDDLQVLLIGAGFLFVLPLALVITGGFIWYRRRRR